MLDSKNSSPPSKTAVNAAPVDGWQRPGMSIN
jgi:hypothetical protein